MSNPLPPSPDTPSPGALSTLALTLAIQVLASAAVIAPTAVAPLLLRELGLPAAAVGFYVALVYLGAVFSSVAGSHFATHHGAIRTSQWSLALCALGLALVASGWGWAAAVAGALVMGLGYGPVTPASSQILARTTPAHRMGLVFSLKQTGVPLGGVIAGTVVPPLALHTGAGWALAALVGAAVACALAAQPLRAALDTALPPPAGGRPGIATLARPVRLVWGSPALRTLAGCSFVFSMVQVCLTAYLVSFLTAQLHWPLVAAGLGLAAAQAAGVAGRVLWGTVADRGPGARRVLVGLCALMIGCALAMPLLRPDSAQALVLAALVLYGGTAIGWNGVHLAAVARLAPPGQAGVATGGTLAFTYFGVVIGPPLFGLLAASGAGHGWAFAATALPLAGCLAALARGRG